MIGRGVLWCSVGGRSLTTNSKTREFETGYGKEKVYRLSGDHR